MGYVHVWTQEMGPLRALSFASVNPSSLLCPKCVPTFCIVILCWGPCNEMYYGGDEKFVRVIMLVGRMSDVVVYKIYIS